MKYVIHAFGFTNSFSLSHRHRRRLMELPILHVGSLGSAPPPPTKGLRVGEQQKLRSAMPPTKALIPTAKTQICTTTDHGFDLGSKNSDLNRHQPWLRFSQQKLRSAMFVLNGLQTCSGYRHSFPQPLLSTIVC